MDIETRFGFAERISDYYENISNNWKKSRKTWKERLEQNQNQLQARNLQLTGQQELPGKGEKKKSNPHTISRQSGSRINQPSRTQPNPNPLTRKSNIIRPGGQGYEDQFKSKPNNALPQSTNENYAQPRQPQKALDFNGSQP